MYYKILYEWIEILIVNILHTALLKKVLDTFLTIRNKKPILPKIIFGGYYVLTAVAYGAFHTSFLYELCNLAGILVTVCFYCAAYEKKVWICMIFFCIDTGCWGMISCAGSEEIVMQQSAAQTLLLLVCVILVCHIFDSKEYQESVLDKRQMFLLVVIPVLSVAAFWMLMYKSAAGFVSVFLCAVIVALNLCVFYLCHILFKNYVQLREQDIYKQQTFAYQNQLEVIRESQSRIRSLKHDMKNHVMALQGLAKGKKTEEMTAYLSSMQEFMQNPSEYVYTGNEALDSLLNFKLQSAKETLKKVETDIVLPEKMKLRSFDFNVIVGNLLDNAIASSIQTEEQYLKLRMRMGNGVLFLYMVNSCLGIPEGVCELRKLSEKSAFGHGTGLGNVQRIVEKYHGDIEMHCEDNHMETDIMLYMKDL